MSSLLQRLILPAALLTVLAPSIPAFSSQPRFFSEPDAIFYRDRSVVVRGRAPFGSSKNLDFLLTVPATGDLPLKFRALTVESQLDGLLVDVLKDPASPLASGAKKAITVERMGLFREVAVAHLRVAADRELFANGMAYRVAGFEVEIGLSEPVAEEDRSTDSALEAGPFRELLDAALTAPDEATRFAAPLAKSPRPGPTEWQPKPENSPDFPWLRIAIAEDGPVLIDAAWLTAAGADPAALRPEDVQLVADGKPVPVLPEGGGKSFADGGTLIFYGRENPSDETRVRQYFLGRISPTITMRWMESATHTTYEQAPPESASGDREYIQQEDKEFQPRLGPFLSIRNMAWVWSELPTSGTLTLPIHPPAFEPTEPIRARLELFHTREQAGSSTTFTLTLGGRKLLDGRIPPVTAPTVEFKIPPEVLKGGAGDLALQTATAPSASARPGSGVWVDQLVLKYKGRYAPQDGVLDVAFPPQTGPSVPMLGAGGAFRGTLSDPRRLRLEGFAAGAKLLALDLSDPDAPIELQDVNPSRVTFGASSKRLLVIDRAKLPAAPAATKPLWQDLASTDHSADVLLIYNTRFADAVEEHASDLRDNGYEVETVDVESIYDAFSNGNLSTDAIRNFIAYAVFQWDGRRPHSVVLYGDANGDGRGIARNGVENLLPVRHIRSSSGSNETEEFASDSWYTWLTEGDELADVLLARVSAIEPAEALSAVHHFVDYRRGQERPAPWANRIVSVSDTGGFAETLDEISDRSLGSHTTNTRIHADDFAWEDNYYLPKAVLSRPEDAKVSPLTTAAIEAAFNDGAALFIYLGHGAPNLWSNQRFWFGGGTPNSDILRLKNDGRLPFVTSFTCNNATIDYPLKPWNICIAEDFMRHEGKGAIGCFMPSGPGFVNQHQILAQGMLHAWSRMGIRRQGVLAELARLNHQIRLRVDNHSRMYLMLGDPTLKLPPSPEQETVAAATKPVLMERINIPAKSDPDALDVVRYVVLGHERDTTATLPVSARLKTPEGEVAVDGAVAAKVPPGARVLVPVRLTAPKAGAYRLEVELPTEPGAPHGDRFPTQHWGDWVVVGTDPAGVRPLPGTALLRRVPKGTTDYLDLKLANLASEMRSGALEWRVMKGTDELAKGDIPLDRVAPRTIQPLSAPLPHVIPGDGLKLDTVVYDSSTPRKEMRRETIDIRGAAQFDLTIMADSLRTEPESPSDGLTIFVTGKVRNQGTEDAPESGIGLYQADKPTMEVLRDLTQASKRTIPALAPGGEAPFRLRWDPSNNAGKQRIAVVLDANGLLQDRDPSNQRAELEITVRTKCQLFTKGIEVRRGDGRTPPVLVARVGNRGETAAGPVVANFYRSRLQNEATKIGETVLEGVPALGEAEATLAWQPTREQLAAPDFEPTFTIALKGSLQRVTSVSETK